MRIMRTIALGFVFALEIAATPLGAGFAVGSVQGKTMQGPLWIGPVAANWIPTDQAAGMTIGGFFEVKKVSVVTATGAGNSRKQSGLCSASNRVVFVDGRSVGALDGQSNKHWGMVRSRMECLPITDNKHQ